MRVDFPAPERPMIATNSPRATARSMPFSTRVSRSPSLKLFTSPLISISSISVAAQDGVEGILAHDHPGGQIPSDEGCGDQEQDAQHRARDGRHDDGVTDGEDDGVCLDVGHEESVEDHEADTGPDERIEEGLEDVGELDCRAGDADALGDTDELPAGHGVDEDEDEYRDAGDDEADRAYRVADRSEGILDLGDPVRDGVLEGLHLGAPA